MIIETQNYKNKFIRVNHHLTINKIMYFKKNSYTS